MLDYDAFIQGTTHFQPRLILKIGGVDVSDRLIEDHSVVTDHVLDTPTLNVFTTARATFCLDNSDNAFNTKATSNFFTTELNRDANGWQTPAEISVVFEGDRNAPTMEKIFFVGYVEEITEMPEPRWVSVLLLDKSGLLQRSVVEDFGSSVNTTIGGRTQNPDYSEVNPFFNLPANSAPVSRSSLTARLPVDDPNILPELTVLPTLPKSGQVLDNRHVAVDEGRGRLYFGAEPEDGVDARPSVKFKTAYRYRTPEFLVDQLLENSGLYSEYTLNEKIFAKSFIKSPVLEIDSGDDSQISSHGRPEVGTVSPVMRWIQSDLSGIYMGGSRTLFRYRRRDERNGVLDKWEPLSNCPDLDAAILQFVKHGDDFYVLTCSDWEGREAKIWKVMGGTAWSEISGTDASAEHFFDYETQSDYAADNRKSFVIDGNYLYYIFDSGSQAGVRRVLLGMTNIVETVIYGGRGTTTLTSAASWDFVIAGTNVYALVCLRPKDSDTYFRVYRASLSGSLNLNIAVQTDLFSHTFGENVGYEPAMVSDVVFRTDSSNIDFLCFVLTYSRSVARVGFAELRYLNVTIPPSGFSLVAAIVNSFLRAPTLSSPEIFYENSLYAARSLVVHRESPTENNIYFIEGTYLSALNGASLELIRRRVLDYPTHEEVGHLQRIDKAGMRVDLGPVWYSFRDPGGTGIGLHTAFCSNLHRNEQDDTLNFISGYGLLSDSAQGTQQSQTDVITASPDNWVWLQYGRKLSTKLPVFPTNDRTVWSLLEELARVVDFELGFTSGQDEIEDFKMLHPHLTGNDVPKPKGYLFFRPRVVKTSDLTVDESDLVGVTSRLDTTLIFNYVSMQYGTGVWIEKDLPANKRVYSLGLPNTFLSDNDGAWAKLICKSYLERQKEPRLKTRIPMKLSPQIELGQRVQVTNEYHSLNETPYRVTEVQHDFNRYQTELEMREDFSLFFLPVIEDLVYASTDTIDFRLPDVIGGLGDLTYTLTGVPMGFVVDSDGQGGAWASPVNGASELTYTVTDAGRSSPGNVLTRKFRLIVESAFTPPVVSDAVSFDGIMISDKFVRSSCYTEIFLPEARTVNRQGLNYEVLGLPSGFSFLEDRLKIVGMSSEGVSSITYRVRRGSQGAWETLTFDLRRENVGKISGLYYQVQGSDINVGILNDGTNELREYNYYTKVRDTTNDIDLTVGNDANADWTGCCVRGSYRIFVDNRNNKGVFYNGNTREGDVNLQTVEMDGDWRDVCEHPTQSNMVLFYNAKTRKFIAYTTGRVRRMPNDITLEYFVDIQSVVKNGNRLLCVVKNSPVLVTVDQMGVVLTTLSDFVPISQGFVGIAWTGTNYLLVRSGSVEVNAFSSAGARSKEDDLRLWS